MRKKLLRLLRVAPVAILLCVGVASAQSMGTGQIVGQVTDAASGKPVAGALVIATSPALQGESTAVSDSKGEYILTTLPPGKYKLAAQLAGYKPLERSDIVLRVGFTLRANLPIIPEAVQMEEQVVKTGVAPVVNIGTAENATVVSKEFLASVPGARTFEAVAAVAPTAQIDAYGISFAGSTSPENNYVIDGMRVSDPNFGTNGTNLLTNFVDQLDIKVGSFMPEFGYSSAGVINTVTKSGSNEFHGSIWGNLTPGFFTPATPAIWRNGEAVASQSTPYKGSYATDFGVELGGPIAKDKLWFYVGFAPQMQYDARTLWYQTRTPVTPGGTVAARDPQTGQYIMTPLALPTQDYGAGFTRYFGIAKLTWLINENHNLFGSFNTQPTSTYGKLGSNGNASALYADTTSNANNATLHYTGKFADKHLLVEAVAGWFGAPNNTVDRTIDGVDVNNTPAISWRSAQRLQNFVPDVGTVCPSTAGAPGVTTVGCFVQNYVTGGTGFVTDISQNRYAGSVSLTGLFNLAGQHQLKGGAQIDYSDYDATRWYSGGVAWRGYGRATFINTGGVANSVNAFYMYRAFGQLDPNSMINSVNSANWTAGPGNLGGKDPTNPGKSVATANTWSNGYYIQDSWTIANVLTLNFGVRLDTQNMSSPSAEAIDPQTQTLSITNEWAPRVQAIWDFTGNGRGKIQGNWGMYYESIPLDAALRGFGGEQQITGAYQLSSCATTDAQGNSLYGAANSSGNPASACGNVYGLATGQGPGPNTVTLGANSGLGLAPGFGYTSSGGSPLAPGLKGQYTTQFGGGIEYEVIQDLSVGADYIGRRIGDIIEDLSSNDGVSYFIANPGVSNAWTQTTGAYAGTTLNPKQAAGVDLAQGVAYSVNWPAPKRSYDGFTLRMNKLFSKRWLAQVSYTYSVLQGNFPGLFRSENNQLDPNITSEYDLVSLLGNKQGPLAGNRTNQIKAYGSYTADLGPNVLLTGGMAFTAFSGVPVSVLGAHPLYGSGESYMISRGYAGNLPWTYKLDLSGSVVWALSGPYSLKFSLDLFNLLNGQTVQAVDSIYTFDTVTPMQGATCTNKNSISQKDASKALLESCPDLAYARTPDNLPVTRNLNYGQATAYQLPINVRFGVALSF
jgi:hypothetical protein